MIYCQEGILDVVHIAIPHDALFTTAPFIAVDHLFVHKTVRPHFVLVLNGDIQEKDGSRCYHLETSAFTFHKSHDHIALFPCDFPKMTPFTALVTFFVLQFIFAAHAQPVDEALFRNLGGEYQRVDLNKMLNFTEDPAFLADICPKTLILSRQSQTTQFQLMFGSEPDPLQEPRCRLSPNESVPLTFARVQLDTEPTPRQVQPQTIPVGEIRDFFPSLLAISPSLLVCPNKTEIFTRILALDTGYFYTSLNHYKSTGDPLGSPFNETDSSNLNTIRGMYSLNLAIDFQSDLGCTYLKSSEKSNLQAKIDEVSATSPSPSPSNASSSEESTCFPSNAKVELADGSLVLMEELKIGDMVRDSSGSTSRVLLFTHADAGVKSEFVVIHTSTAQVALSASHFIYRSEELVPAAAIEVGDEVTVVKPRSNEAVKAHVVKVEREVLSGLYNPQTASGSIVVSWHGEGILTSTYTTAIPPVTAHALLGPLRFLEIYFDMTISQLSLLFRSKAKVPGLVRSMVAGRMNY